MEELELFFVLASLEGCVVESSVMCHMVEWALCWLCSSVWVTILQFSLSFKCLTEPSVSSVV